jgi:hypothetical protein
MLVGGGVYKYKRCGTKRDKEGLEGCGKTEK